MRRFNKYLLLGLTTLALTACMNLSPVATPRINHYLINSLPKVTMPTKTSALSLTVMPMTAASGFDSNAMLYLTKPYQLAAFSQNDWLVAPSAMLNTLLLTSLQESHAFSAVVGATTVANTDLILNSQLLCLYQDFTVSPSQVVLTVQVSLANKAGKILASAQISSRIPATADNPAAGVVAANQAATAVLSKIQNFVENAVGS